jgi:hypothetical protein
MTKLQKGSSGLIVVLALALVLGAVYIYQSNSEVKEKTLASASDHSSAPIARAPEVPLYESLAWETVTAPSTHILTRADGTTIPLTGKTFSAKRSDGTQGSSLEGIGEFETRYDTLLTSQGWVRNEVTANRKTVMGPIAEGAAGNTWSYIKIQNDSLYTAVFSTNTTGKASTDGEYELVCPCSTTFTLFVSDAVPVSNI